jgi:hypothetical protein
MPKFDVTKLNVATDKLLETTENPRHRFMLQAFSRHRYLEVAGRYEEIFAPDMMSENPAYHMHIGETTNAALEGQEQIKGLYRMWAETNQCIFYATAEEVAIADHFIATVTSGYQQVAGKSLKEGQVLSHLPHGLSARILKKALATKSFKADDNDMYLYKMTVEMVWPYDDRGRLVGEDVWQPEPEKGELIKLEPSDVLTVQESARLLNPFIKPLPLFDEVVLKKTQTAGR